MNLIGGGGSPSASVVVASWRCAVNTVFDRPSEECGPVKDLLEFNASQAELIASSPVTPKGSDLAEDAAYQEWADGLAERAQNVSEPNLARTSTEVANLANEFTGKLSVLRAQTESRAPGAPAPPAAYETAASNTQISEHLAELADACPDVTRTYRDPGYRERRPQLPENTTSSSGSRWWPCASRSMISGGALS